MARALTIDRLPRSAFNSEVRFNLERDFAPTCPTSALFVGAVSVVQQAAASSNKESSKQPNERRRAPACFLSFFVSSAISHPPLHPSKQESKWALKLRKPI